MMDKNLEQMVRYIKLKGLLKDWDTYLELAEKQKFSYTKLLKFIIEKEYSLKKENSRSMRLKRAKLPESFVMETFPFDRQPKLNRKKVISIYDSFDYIQKKQNIILIGPTGTGKTGLGTAYMVKAINHGYTGKYILFPELVDKLFQSKADLSEQKMIKQFTAYDCLLIDEIGYVDIEPVQVGLFFTLMHKRHKKKCTIITSNLGFSEWISFLKNDQLTAALIDRLTENSYLISMKNCSSLRVSSQ